MKRCSLVAVGDELLDGRVTDTNTEYLARELSSRGWDIVFRLVVGDRMDLLVDTVSWVSRHSDLVVIVGGLGPTADDITREAVSRALNRPLRRDKEMEARIRGFFSTLGREMSPSNSRQADLLEGAEWIGPRLGTAPGQWLEHEGGIVVLLPGVPREMTDILQNEVFPRLEACFPGPGLAVGRLVVAARPESEVGEVVGAALQTMEGLRISYRALTGQIEIRVSSRDEEKVAEAVRRLQEQLGFWVVAQGEESVEETLGRELRSRGLTIAVAESCTGGMVGERITAVPGSSDYFRGGVVAYTYTAKERLLGVDGSLLRRMGAVNEEVAKAMAEGVRERLGSDLGLSVTGVAGPGGGGEREPVGTVAFGLADGKDTLAVKYRLPGDRENVRRFAASIALAMVIFRLRGVRVDEVR